MSALVLILIALVGSFLSTGYLKLQIIPACEQPFESVAAQSLLNWMDKVFREKKRDGCPRSQICRIRGMFSKFFGKNSQFPHCEEKFEFLEKKKMEV